MFNLAEAVDICESHAQCQAFVVTNQTTWTGEPVGKDMLREVTGVPWKRLTDSGPPSGASFDEKIRRPEDESQVSVSSGQSR